MKGIFWTTFKCLMMFWAAFVASCTNHEEQIGNVINKLEWIDSELDEIGERNIKGYRQKLHIPSNGEEHDADSIVMTEAEFRDLQIEIYSATTDLEELLREMQKEHDAE